MKTLFLLRHAKSSWKDASLADFDRPLSARGLKAATLVGRYLRRRKLRPDLVLSSPAERARRTAALVSESSGGAAGLMFDERIYEAGAARLLEVVTQIGEAVEGAMLVGHNPGMEELLALLTGETKRMRTATLACVALDVEKWSRARAGSGRLEWIVCPKDIEGE